MNPAIITSATPLRVGGTRASLESIAHGTYLDAHRFVAHGMVAKVSITSDDTETAVEAVHEVGVGSVLAIGERHFAVAAVECVGDRSSRCVLEQFTAGDNLPRYRGETRSRPSMMLSLSSSADSVGDWNVGDEPVFRLIRRFRELRRSGEQAEAVSLSRSVAAAFGSRVPAVDRQVLRFFDECGPAPGSERLAGVILGDPAYFRGPGAAFESHGWRSDGSWFHYSCRVALQTAALEEYAGRVLLHESRELALCGEARRLVEVLFSRDTDWVIPRWETLARLNWQQTRPIAEWLAARGMQPADIVPLLLPNQSFTGLHDLKRFVYHAWPLGDERERFIEMIDSRRSAALLRQRRGEVLSCLHRRMFALASHGV